MRRIEREVHPLVHFLALDLEALLRANRALLLLGLLLISSGLYALMEGRAQSEPISRRGKAPLRLAGAVRVFAEGVRHLAWKQLRQVETMQGLFDVRHPELLPLEDLLPILEDAQ